MNNVTQSERVYVERWNEYIDGLSSLLFTETDLSKQVKEHIDGLKALVPQIAQKKKFRWAA